MSWYVLCDWHAKTNNGEGIKSITSLLSDMLHGKRDIPKMDDKSVMAIKSQLAKLKKVTQSMMQEQTLMHQDIVDKMTKHSVYVDRLKELESRYNRDDEWEWW